MAINSYEDVQLKLLSSSGRLKYGKLSDCSSTASTLRSKSSKVKFTKSPYLVDDKVYLLTRETEKKFLHKKRVNTSTNPTVNVYKVNSDEIKPKQKLKKNKKSVLTLPNEPAPKAKECTVSDMNESDYFNNNEENKKVKSKKRMLAPKPEQIHKNQVDYSSTDVSKSSKSKKTKKPEFQKVKPSDSGNAHEIWSMLRNMNWFHHRPSPPMSENSVIVSPIKKTKRKQKSKDGRVFKTQESQEFTFIKLNSIYGSSCSPTSSLDRITVIDKQEDFKRIYNSFEKHVFANDNTKDFMNKTNRKKRITKKNRNIEKPGTQENKPIIQQNKIKLNLNVDTKSKDSMTNKSDGADSVEDKSIQANTKITNYYSENQTCTKNDVPKSLNIIDSGSSKAGYVNYKKDQEQLTNSKHKPKQTFKVKKSENDKPLEQLSIVNKFESKKKQSQLIIQKSSADLLSAHNEGGKQRLDIKFPIVFVGQDDHGSSSVLEIRQSNSFLSFMNDARQKHSFEKRLSKEQKDKSNKTSSAVKNPDCVSVALPDQNLMLKLSSPNSVKHHQGTQDNTSVKKNVNRDRRGDQFTIDNTFQPLMKDKMINLVKKSTLFKRIVNNKPLDEEMQEKDYTNLQTKHNSAVQSQTMNINSQTNNLTKNVSTNDKIDSAIIIEDSAKKKQPKNKLTWAKARCVNDFVANVINKIMSGIYYNVDDANVGRLLNDNKPRLKSPRRTSPHKVQHTVETSVMNTNQSASNNETKLNNDPVKKIIGTDDTFNKVEIDSFVTNQIALKDLSSNVIVQFDINISLNPDNVKRDNNLICEPPIIQENKMKLFKCKTTIINSMLPAEICTLLPEIMRVIMVANKKQSNLAPLIPLPSITETSNELSQCDLQEPIIRHISLPCYVFRLCNGCFRKVNSKTDEKTTLAPRISYFSKEIDLFSNFQHEEMQTRTVNLQKELLDKIIVKPEHKVCEPILKGSYDVVSYKPVYCNDFISGNSDNNKLVSFLDNDKNELMNCCITVNINHDLMDNIKMGNGFTYKNAMCAIYFTRESYLAVQKLVSSKNILDKYKGVLQHIHKKVDEFRLKCLELTDKKTISFNMHEKPKHESVKVVYRPKAKIHMKTHGKSKSTTNMSDDNRHINLNKIKDIETFYKIFGTCKMLANVFDGCSESKILSFLGEMKCWIKEINSRQAMLVLIFANKKETRTLMCYRPIILQGIAVKRITTATELDMEIEVLETERPTLCKYEGISYYPSALENKSNLFEELLWIAKTTASDYQKPFNDSSVKLLKSLLEKRKKLNPSYLRVMARYVGLGLLKAVNENK